LSYSGLPDGVGIFVPKTSILIHFGRPRCGKFWPFGRSYGLLALIFGSHLVFM
jgi:hypothetical protein